MSHLEHRKHLERELRNAGIKPEILRTEGGHMRIVFEAGGKPQTILTSWTPSDHRSTLNARARIRKILRSSGALDKAVPVGKLDKALSLPAPTEPFMERIAQLEHDVAMLLDMLSLVADHAGVDLEPPAPPPEVPPSLVLTTLATEVVTKSYAKMDDLLAGVGFTWTPIREIEAHSGRGRARTASALQYMKAKGMIERGARGMWRRVPGAVIPPRYTARPAPMRGPSKSGRGK